VAQLRYNIAPASGSHAYPHNSPTGAGWGPVRVHCGPIRVPCPLLDPLQSQGTTNRPASAADRLSGTDGILTTWGPPSSAKNGAKSYGNFLIFPGPFEKLFLGCKYLYLQCILRIQCHFRWMTGTIGRYLCRCIIKNNHMPFSHRGY